MPQEKRKYPRFPTSLDTIYFREDPDNHNDRMYFPGTIVNQSNGGVGMVVSFPHEPSHELWLEGLGLGENPIAGLVRWIVKGAAADQYHLGIQFSEL